ncbi:scaffold attachment factor B1-like isoform X1 [Argonauta hians]
MSSANGEICSENNKLEDLKVVDLRNELEKRGLDKTGVKAVLLERLEEALKSEGKDAGNMEGCQVKSAPPEQSSSSAETNVTEENSEELLASKKTTKVDKSEVSLSSEVKEEKNEKLTSPTSMKPTTTPPTSPPKGQQLQKDKMEDKTVSDNKPPTSDIKQEISVTPEKPTDLDSSSCQPNEENESLIVLVDDTQNDLDADLEATKGNKGNLKKKCEGKGSDSSEGKKTDGIKEETERMMDKTEGEEEGKDGKESVKKEAEEKKDDKDVKLKSSSLSKTRNVKSSNQNSRNLWVSGLASSTRATDLKLLFTKYGKVVGAKIVTNARSPGARCYGFITMSTSDEASKCIQHLNQTELHGRMISVERAKREPGLQNSGTQEKSGEKKTEMAEVKKDEKKDGDTKVNKNEPKKGDRYRGSSSRRDDRRHTSYSRSSRHTPLGKSRPSTTSSSSRSQTSTKPHSKESCDKSTKPSSTGDSKEKVSVKEENEPAEKKDTCESKKDRNGKDNKKDILSFDRIKKERERQRLRLRQRHIRERERHRRTSLDRRSPRSHDDDYNHRKQKEKAEKLERVREQIRRERQQLEKELLERERYKLQQEFMERERVREQQHRAELLRLEELRRSIKRPYEEQLWDESKRSRMNNSSHPPRFDPGYQNESRYNDHQQREDPQRRVDRYERRDSGIHFDERKEREMVRRDTDHVRNVRDERRPENRSQTENSINRPSYDFRRDAVLPRDRYVTSEQGREGERRNISAHDRLGRMRSSSEVGSDQRSSWSSDNIRRKVDSWPHLHSNTNNTGMSHSSDRWPGNSMNTTGRGSSGVFGNSGGVSHTMRAPNIYSNVQSSTGLLVTPLGGGGGGGSNSMSGSRMQEPQFDAYKMMGSM